MNTSNMTFGMKVVIVIFAVILVLSLMLPFFSSCGKANTAQQNDPSQVDQNNVKTASDVDATYSAKVRSYSAQLDKNPDDLLALANMGNTYMEWGEALRGAADGEVGQSSHIRDIFGAAVPYFSAYLDHQDSNAVRVYAAVSKFYSGDEQGAIDELENFTAENPDFSPAWYNLGVFYQQQHRYSEANDAYNSAISADEIDSYNMGTYSSYALQVLSALEDAENNNDLSASLDGYELSFGFDAANSSFAANASRAADTLDESDESGVQDTDGLTGGAAVTPDEKDSSSSN